MKNLFVGFMTLWLCLASQADDIDIYQGQSTGIPNNVMFLMDTSRSMSRWVYFDIGLYDPTETYPVPINGFDPETYYYSIIIDGDGSTDTETGLLYDRFLHKNAIKCAGAVDTIEEDGFITGKFKRWDPLDQNWEAPSTNWSSGIDLGDMREDAIWECKNDEQVDPINKDIRFIGSTNSNQYTGRPARTFELCAPFLGCLDFPNPLYASYILAYEAAWFISINNIFKGNYLNYQILEQGNNEDGDGNGSLDDRASRMTLARAAAKYAANTIQGFNLGLARFDSNNKGGFIDLPIAPIDTNKTLFNEKIDTYFTYGGTPLSESYFEIARYYRGDGITSNGNVYFGNDSHSRIQEGVVNRFASGMVSSYSAQFNSRTIDTPSVSSSRTGNTYISPITSACQATSAIVLFTDGEPQSDDEANPLIRSMIQHVASEFPAELDPTTCSGNGGCADELAYYLANYDQSDLPGRQTIRTYVVGGFLTDTSGGEDDADDGGSNNDLNGIPLLRSIARYGDGQYFGADNYEDIATALTEIFGSVAEIPATFVAPAVSTNSYNSLEHQDELYYAMFKPSSGANWQGNLKLYTLSFDGIVMDANNNPAIGSDGVIQNNARSYWTPTGEDNADGPNVTLGGAAQHLTKNQKIFTHLTTIEGPLTTTITDTAEMRTLMQVPASMSPEDFSRTVDWANRIDLENTDGNRKEMEDPLHSRPVVINYTTIVNSTTDEVTTDSVVYMATNSGYLHAFKASKETYEEYFSYIPKELLPNIAKYANNSSLRKDELYGLDGHISYAFKDVNKNGQVDPGDGDRVILYIGMRRGGNHYYAIDVTNRTTPKYLWQIDGGMGDFARLGQSWSEMTLTKVNFNGTQRDVLFFGGGYDENEDDTVSASSTQLGNAIYMVDALSGDLLWTASNSDMTASFMNSIRLVDYNGDRITDFFYASDVAGRIWRFDIGKDNTGATDFADGGIIFDANGDSSDSTYNRFYNSPSISYFKDEIGVGFLTISIGTGFRASPLAASSDDAFYILKDYDIVNKPVSYTPQTPSDLAHFSLADGTQSNSADVNQRQGWKFTLSGTSEKVLADALTNDGRVIFTTFAPNSNPNPGTCSFDLGTSKAYSIDLQGGADNQPILEISSCEASGTCIQLPPLVPPVAVITPTPNCEDLGTCPLPNCEVDDTCPPEPSCEDGGGAVILIGTTKLGETISRCGILNKDYWLER
jgi:type IV pilus assembly protein PilY1